MLAFNQFYQGDVLDLAPKLGPGVINLILTSPPYFQQRDYGLPSTDWPEVTSDYGGKRLTTVQTEDGSFIKRETEEESLGPRRSIARCLGDKASSPKR